VVYISFSSREFVYNQNRAKKELEIPDNPLALVVFPESKKLDEQVTAIVQGCNGVLLSANWRKKDGAGTLLSHAPKGAG